MKFRIFISLLVSITILLTSCQKDSKNQTSLYETSPVENSNYAQEEVVKTEAKHYIDIFQGIKSSIYPDITTPYRFFTQNMDFLRSVYELTPTDEKIDCFAAMGVAKPENSYDAKSLQMLNTPIEDVNFISYELPQENYYWLKDKIIALRVTGDITWYKIFHQETNIIEDRTLTIGMTFSEIRDCSRNLTDDSNAVYHPVEFSGYYGSNEYKTYYLIYYYTTLTYIFTSGDAGEPVYRDLYIRRADPHFDGLAIVGVQDQMNIPREAGPLSLVTVEDCTIDNFKYFLETNTESIIAEYGLTGYWSASKRNYKNPIAEVFYVTSENGERWPYTPVEGMGITYACSDVFGGNIDGLKMPSPFLYVESGKILGLDVRNDFSSIKETWGEPNVHDIYILKEDENNTVDAGEYEYMVYNRDGLNFVFMGKEKNKDGNTIAYWSMIFLEDSPYFDSRGKLIDFVM